MLLVAPSPTPPAAATPAASEMMLFQVRTISGEARARLPGSLAFAILPNAARLPTGTAIQVSDGAEIEVTSSLGDKAVVETEGTFILPRRGRQSETWGRLSFGKESDVALELGVPTTIKKKIMAFFTGTIIPTESRASSTNLAKSILHPINVIAPEKVAVIETSVFPVTVAMQWEIGGLQLDPHRVFLWTEKQMQYTPYAVSSGGQASVQVWDYGMFFWQVEDASGTFASVPRTIFVSPPGRSSGAEPDGPAGADLLPLLRPQQSTTLYHCFEKAAVELPVWFLHANARLVSFRAQVLPTPDGVSPAVSSGVAHEKNISIRFSKPGRYKVSIFGFDDPSPQENARPAARSPELSVRVENDCSRTGVPTLFTERSQTGISPFPLSGTLILSKN